MPREAQCLEDNLIAVLVYLLLTDAEPPASLQPFDGLRKRRSGEGQTEPLELGKPFYTANVLILQLY